MKNFIKLQELGKKITSTSITNSNYKISLMRKKV